MSLIDQLNSKIEEHGTGFKKSQQGTNCDVQSVFVPIEVEHNGGKMRAYLQFPGEFALDYDIFKSLLEWVEQRYDIPVFKPKYNNDKGFKKYNKYRG